MTTIDDTNYELWLLRYAEGELVSAEEIAAVEQWLSAHPDAVEELALYREAPRLERDESVRFAAAPLPEVPVRTFWPLLGRWAAAAAVVTALMLPALRTARMDSAEVPLLARGEQGIEGGGRLDCREETDGMEGMDVIGVARAAGATSPIRSINAVASVPAMRSILSTDSVASSPVAPGDALAAADVPAAEAAIPVNSLIAVSEKAGAEPSIEASTALIAFEAPDWGDRLLALSEAGHETLSQSAGGRLVSRLLPDSRRLEVRIVEPLREGISYAASKFKKPIL